MFRQRVHQIANSLKHYVEKYPDKWYQTAFPEEAQTRLTQKVEVDTTQKIINLDHISVEQLFVLKYGRKPKR